jgi:hypothetical protein
MAQPHKSFNSKFILDYTSLIQLQNITYKVAQTELEMFYSIKIRTMEQIKSSIYKIFKKKH